MPIRGARGKERLLGRGGEREREIATERSGGKERSGGIGGGDGVQCAETPPSLEVESDRRMHGRQGALR